MAMQKKMGLISRDCEDIESLLTLNPRVAHNASWKPSIVTKDEKKKWKRNEDKNCSVSLWIFILFIQKINRFNYSFILFPVLSTVDQ